MSSTRVSTVTTYSQHHLADTMLPNWSCGKWPALEVSITFLLPPPNVSMASEKKGEALKQANLRSTITDILLCQEGGLDFYAVHFMASSCAFAIHRLPEILLSKSARVSLKPPTGVLINRMNSNMAMSRRPEEFHHTLQRCPNDWGRKFKAGQFRLTSERLEMADKTPSLV